MNRPAPRLSQSQKLRLNVGLATSIRVLRFDASGLTRYLEEQASENPHLVLAPVEVPPGEWLPRWHTAFAEHGMGRANQPDFAAMLQAPSMGLIAHVTGQIERLFPRGRTREIAFALMQALEPSGWLGQHLPALSAEIGCSVPEAGAVLARLQQMEPTGIFARSLAECLHLQAAEAGKLDPTMACMLEHLDLLAAGEIAQLARLCRVVEPEITQRLRIIRSFDPKPGARFGQNAAPVRDPDLTVSRGPQGWTVSLNRSALPDVHLREALPDGATKASSEALTQARELVRVVASRNQTLLRIAQEILQRQEATISRGQEALIPMTMEDVGAALGLHKSTISRAIAGVSADTPRGTIWLRSLFTVPVGGRDGGTGGVAAGALRARLLRLIRQEPQAAPLSDQALAEALSTPQASVARRTVAKYRALLGIAPAHRRKKR